MGFTDIFTGGGKARAEKATRGIQGQYFDDNISTLSNAYGTAQDSLNSGANNAINTLQGGRDAAGNTIRAGTQTAQGYINQGTQGAIDALGGARAAYGDAGAAYNPVSDLSGKYGGATQALLDALGINGADGGARAGVAFENSLGTDFVKNQGLQDLIGARRAAGDGTFSGGNVDRELLNYAQDRNAARSNDYIAQLSQFINPELAATTTAAAGQAGAYNNIANTNVLEAGVNERAGLTQAGLASDEATKIANLASGTSAGVAGLQSDLGAQLANLALGQGNAQIGLTKDLANAYSGSLQKEAGFRDEGNKTTLAAVLKGAELAAGLAGGLPPGTLSGLFSSPAAASAPIPIPKPIPGV